MLGVAFTTSSLAEASGPSKVVVAGNAFPWVDTGYSVTDGAAVVVTATGTWTVGGPYGTFNAGGATGFGTESCAPVTSAPMGALIGSVDGGASWFLVGVGPTRVSTPGRLLLGANDCSGPGGSFFSDNGGSLVATISPADPLPPPGSMLGWGANNKAQSGPVAVGETTTLPQSVHFTNVVAAGGGCCHSIALKADGTVWGWGENTFAQIGERPSGSDVRQIVGIDNVVAVSAGSYHVLALKNDGSVWGWGDNFYRELGTRSDAPAAGYTVPSFPTPAPIEAIDHVVAVAAGYFYSLALRDDGTVWGWGYNNEGQIGLENPQAAAPRPIAGLEHVVSIKAGVSHGLALKGDGTVWVWGDNAQGQLSAAGSGPYAPFQIMDGARAIAAGTQHNLVLKRDGSVWAWGENTYSQSGDVASPMVPPHQVLPPGSAVAIAAGSHHSLALASDGHVWKWGDVPAGAPTPALGLPHQVAGLVHATGIGAGWFQSLAIAPPPAVTELTLTDTSATAGESTAAVSATVIAAAAPLAAKRISFTVDRARDTSAISDPAGFATATISISGLFVGDHPLRATFTGDEDVSSALADARLAIANAALTIGWPAPSAIVYGTPLGAAQLNATATVNGVPVDGTFVYSPASGTMLDAGRGQPLSVTFTPADQTRNHATSASVTIDVSPAPLTVVANSATRPYGDANTGLTGSIGGALASDALTFTLATSATASSPVGEYPIVPTVVDSSHRLANYVLTTTSGVLTVTRAALAVAAVDATRLVGAANPSFAATFSGFKLGEDAAVLLTPVTFTTTAAPGSPAGTYIVTPGGATAANYAVSFLPGTLTVTNNVCALYDQTRPVKSGATMPIKVALCDANGVNLSNPMIALTATGVSFVSVNVDGVPQDAGNANPDSNFRYDESLGGYIFNLQTTGLTTGTYQLNFSASGDPVTHNVHFAIR